MLTGKGWETVPPAYRKQADTPWFQSFLAFDPAKVMRDVRQPILIVQGMLDTQVPPANADRLEALARGRKNPPAVEVAKVPGVNHLLVPATTGEFDEYSSAQRQARQPGHLDGGRELAAEDVRPRAGEERRSWPLAGIPPRTTAPMRHPGLPRPHTGAGRARTAEGRAQTNPRTTYLTRTLSKPAPLDPFPDCT